MSTVATDVAPKPGQHIRNAMDVIWGFLLSLIITEYFKGAYRVLDRRISLDIVLTLAACAMFLAKQVADIYLYYKQFDRYDIKLSGEGWRVRMARLLSENLIEVLVFFFTYGAIQSIAVHNIADNVDGAFRLKRSVGSGLLISVALGEISWLLWEIVYLWKRRAESSLSWWATVRLVFTSKLREDTHVQKWIILNSVFAVVFLAYFFHFRFQGFWPTGRIRTSIPDAGVAFWCLFLPVTVYFIVYHYVLRDYYLGEGAESAK